MKFTLLSSKLQITILKTQAQNLDPTIRNSVTTKCLTQLTITNLAVITNTNAFQVHTVTDAGSNIYQTTRYHNTEYQMSTKYQNNVKPHPAS
jgi:hypothetical protein